MYALWVTGVVWGGHWDWEGEGVVDRVEWWMGGVWGWKGGGMG